MEKGGRSAQPKRKKRKLLLALLRKVRLDAGMRQADLAKSLGRPQSFVSKYESGERRLDLLELEEVCRRLGVSLIRFVEMYQESIRKNG